MDGTKVGGCEDDELGVADTSAGAVEGNIVGNDEGEYVDSSDGNIVGIIDGSNEG